MTVSCFFGDVAVVLLFGRNLTFDCRSSRDISCSCSGVVVVVVVVVVVAAVIGSSSSNCSSSSDSECYFFVDVAVVLLFCRNLTFDCRSSGGVS